MKVIKYVKKIFKSLCTRGPLNTITYGYHVLKKKFLDIYIDIKYGGKVCAYKIDSNIPGCHAVMHSNYYVLDEIFKYVSINRNDVLVDVGCGQGRIINYWLSKGIKNRIFGLEINKEIAEDASKRYDKYNNVQIIQGDAVNNLPENGTIFFLFNPFSLDRIQAMAEKLKNKPVKIIYYNYTCLEAFENSAWEIEHKNSNIDICTYRVAILTPINSMV